MSGDTLDSAWRGVLAVLPKGDDRHKWYFAGLRGNHESRWEARAVQRVLPVWSQDWTDWNSVIATKAHPIEALNALENSLRDWKEPVSWD